MDRRSFVARGLGGTLGALALGGARAHAAAPADDIRGAFPRLNEETYLNAAGMMPLGAFSLKGMEAYQAFQQLGPAEGRAAYLGEVQDQVHRLFASLVGADADEVGLVHCTKAGEQVAIDAVDAKQPGANIVTNDLHFTGSLHNLVGLRQAGLDVRIVRATDWQVTAEAMAAAMDDRTALVAVSLVSNINGHIEDVRALATAAHAHGALLYADVIQAAGILPLNLREMDIDVAACSCYKWLYGVYGTGFLYVRRTLQGTRLPDRLFPGSARHNYAPWVAAPDPAHGDFRYQAPADAHRYQPGHVSYVGYCAAYEGLKFLHEVGVHHAHAHTVRLNRRLHEALDTARYRCITPEVDRAPLITFLVDDPADVRARLNEAKIAASLSGPRLRVSPALYNTDADVDLLAEVLNR